jgi:hypothetical protein
MLEATVGAPGNPISLYLTGDEAHDLEGADALLLGVRLRCSAPIAGTTPQRALAPRDAVPRYRHA